MSEAAVQAVVDVLAPGGYPIFEWGHEETPSPPEIRTLAEQIVDAIERTQA